MFIKRNIPNAITCGNLFCGCLAIVSIAEGDLLWAGILVGLAAVLDFFDGMVARVLNVQSPIGKDLDSLADVVSFGFVPGYVIYKLLVFSLMGSMVLDSPGSEEIQGSTEKLWPYLGFLVTIFSAIRLAKFNNDPRQSESFRGLPVPANAILICSLPIILRIKPDSLLWLLNPWLLSATALCFSLLLVSDLPLFSLKFKNFGWHSNKIRFLFLTLCAGMLVAFQLVAIPLIIILYIFLSIVNNIFSKKEV